jgi:hypothetical protein
MRCWLALLGLCAAACPCPPVPEPREPMVVYDRCTLPPLPANLPVAHTVDAGSLKLFCYDIEGARNIMLRDQQLRQWVREVWARCARPAQPSDVGPPRGDSRAGTRQDGLVH